MKVGHNIMPKRLPPPSKRPKKPVGRVLSEEEVWVKFATAAMASGMYTGSVIDVVDVVDKLTEAFKSRYKKKQ